ncbi:MAG: flagellar FliJ family protein [Bacteroidetes bacterium]|nr:flagellar FliJ family protein [Bacteroidota bacterium]MBU1115151.1 flagellar FliJ family protein [Bacteroidota bacterium]MBU1799322.1 flagellar FliJ family protein [Bacteroidota bacterium]
MKKFNYKFDAILKVKDNIKKQAMKEVAEVGKEIEQRLLKKENLVAELKDCKLNSKKKTMKVSELQFIESHIYSLNKKIQTVDNEIIRLKYLLKMKQSVLVEKTKESKIFHKLKETKLIQHKSDENKEELKMLDELAIQKMSRN